MSWISKIGSALLTLAVLASACQRSAVSPPASPRPHQLCGLEFREASGCALEASPGQPVVRVIGSIGSFLIPNLSSDHQRPCRFELHGPGVSARTVFTRYGELDRGRVQIEELGPGRVRIDYPIPGHSYGLISVEPRVDPPSDPGTFEQAGLRYTVYGGTFLRLEQNQPLVRSLGPATHVEIENPTPGARPVIFALDNTSDRLSEPRLTGLENGRLRHQGELRLQISGSLPAGAKARLELVPRPLPTPWSFLVGGDIKAGLGTFLSLIEQAQLAGDPLFLIATGDFTRNSLPEELEDYFRRTAQVPFPIYPVKGNHENRVQGTRHYPRMFGPDHYAFRVGDLWFGVLDASEYQARGGQTGYAIAPGQFDWLQAQLEPLRPSTRKVIALHAPPFPLHGATPRAQYASNLLEDDAVRLRALATRYQVRYVLSGHAHLYARKQERATVYLTSGGGGAELHSYEPVAGFDIRPIHHLVLLQVGLERIDERIIELPRPAHP